MRSNSAAWMPGAATTMLDGSAGPPSKSLVDAPRLAGDQLAGGGVPRVRDAPRSRRRPARRPPSTGRSPPTRPADVTDLGDQPGDRGRLRGAPRRNGTRSRWRRAPARGRSRRCTGSAGRRAWPRRRAGRRTARRRPGRRPPRRRSRRRYATATDVHHAGRSYTKFVVPSIGSRNHAYPLVPVERRRLPRRRSRRSGRSVRSRPTIRASAARSCCVTRSVVDDLVIRSSTEPRLPVRASGSGLAGEAGRELEQRVGIVGPDRLRSVSSHRG